MTDSGIYAIYSPSGARYVGSAVNLKRRWYLHKRGLERRDHHCAALLRAANKYGIHALTFEVLEFCRPEDLIAREQCHIDATPVRRRYNSSPTAGNTYGTKHSAAARLNMRNAQLGKKRPDEVKAKISEYQRNKPPASAETRLRMRNAQLGKKHAKRPPRSPETLEFMAERRSAATNTSGAQGVHFHKGARKWMARHRDKYIGLFSTVEDAASAREAYIAALSCTIAPNT